MRNSRCGSVLIYFIGLAAIVVIIAFSFLRSLVADAGAGDSSIKFALAQSAARQGLNHALEEIIRDESTATVAVGSGAGPVVTIPAPTFIDGPFRAQFVSSRRPYEVHNVDYYGSDSDIDVGNENLLLRPLFPQGTNESYKWYDLGLSVYDGRGRYIEPNYHNLTRPSPVAAAPPVAPLDFTNLSAAGPERDQALYLDSNFRRVDTGNAVTDRATARYRLRYALGVTDLSGQLLCNPQPDFNGDPNVAANSYRSPPAHVAAAQHGWYNLVSTFAPPPRYTDQANAVAGLRAEHVFLGRGYASNFDRQAGTGKPVTFPMMMRRHKGLANANDQFWGMYGLAGYFPTDECEGLYTNTGTPASAAGGVPLAPFASNGDEFAPFISDVFGPQLSWRNHFHAVAGWSPWNGDGISGNHSIGRREQMMMVTPYGRGLRRSAGAPGSWGPYDGRVDCTWYVNILTAPPNVINSMVWAYLPSSVKTLKYTRESYQKYTGPNAFGHNTWGPIISTSTMPEQNRSIHGRDLFTRLCSPAFAIYQPPSTPGIDPNFQIYSSIDTSGNVTGVRHEPRGPEARYPGKLWNGNSTVAGEGEDNLGKDINVNTTFAKHGLCSHTRVPLLADLGGDITFWRKTDSPKGTPPPPPWGTDDLDSFTWSVDPVLYKFNDSYWWDVLKAFSTAVAFTRAQWVQYPTTTFNPQTTGFNPTSLRNPAAHDSLEELDRLFLRQLGENFDLPGTAGSMQIPLVQDASWDGTGQRWSLGTVAANHNIKSLLDGDLIKTSSVTSLERSKVMEMTLNDFRMTFFGAGPQYSETFLPKDFNGDGRVNCSAYIVNAAASAAETANGTSQWKLVADASAIDTWFSLTGCFFIGKSHHYRVLARGEVWDNMLHKPVSGVTLESVVVVDPAGSGQRNTHIPFQRWHFNRYTGDLPLQEE